MRDVLRRLLAGELTEDEALAELRSLQLEELGGRARLDLGRFMRRGIPEVVLATGKAPAEGARLAVALAERQGQGLISRMTPEHQIALRDAAGAAQFGFRAVWANRLGAPRENLPGTLAAEIRDLDALPGLLGL